MAMIMEDDPWKQFMSTGRVEDYLSYRNSQAEAKQQSDEGSRDFGRRNDSGDRDGAYGISHQRVR